MAFGSIKPSYELNRARLRIAPVFFGALAAALLGLSALEAQAETLLPYATFTKDRQFAVLAPRKATPIRGDYPVEVFAYDEALAQCDLTPAQIEGAFAKIFRQDGKLERSLKKLFPEPLAELPKQKRIVLLDAFGPKRHIFRSFFIRDIGEADKSAQGPVQLIGLDCSIFVRSDWASLLGHELTHALLTRLNLPSWFDETLAQLIEVEAGGKVPEFTLDAFSQSDKLPPLLDERRPLQGDGSYALTYLFGKYLISRWGGWTTLQAMLGQAHEASEQQDFWTRAAALAQKSLSQRKFPKALVERATAKGLIRFFAAALVLHSNSEPFYQIPGWRGWRRPLEEGLACSESHLAPGQFQVLAYPSSGQPRLEWAPGAQVEAYPILAWNDGFTITPRDEATHKFPENPKILASAGVAPRHFVLVLNFDSKPAHFRLSDD
jgi:hypothetical protein